MKALTVHPAWAWAFLHFGKDVENRSWYPRSLDVGEKFAIHAGAMKRPAKTRDDFAWMVSHGLATPGTVPTDAELAEIAGKVVAIATYGGPGRWESRWVMGPALWGVDDVRPLPAPIPCRGALGLWELPASVQDAALAQVERGAL